MTRPCGPQRPALVGWLVGVVALVALLHAPTSATAASPLKEARACAARADSSCVVRLLGTAKPTLAEAPEHWLSLAFAQSRLGRHVEAQAAFRIWLKLSPTHRLDRGQMPARIWPDYVAALLAHHGGALDLEPRVTRTPKPVAVEGSWRDLPVLPPPPRSDRDRARDTELVLGPDVGVPMGIDGLAVSLSLLIRLRVRPALQVGLGAIAMSVPARTGTRDVTGVLGVHGEWALMQSGWGRLSVGALAGAGLLQGQDGKQRIDPVIAPSVRYAWLPKSASMGVEVSLSDRVSLGGDTTAQTIVFGIGLLLRPGKTSAAGKDRR